MKFDRSFYIPKGAIADDTHADIGLMLYSYESAGAIYGLAFLGKQAKPVWHHRFRSIEQREAKFTEQVKATRATVAYKTERAAKKAAFQPSLKVGDLLVCSWGYDQTNVNYYEVVAVNGKMVDIREVAQTSTETGWLRGQCSPKKGAFIGPVMRKRVQEGNRVRIASYASAGPCSETDTRYWSSYA